MQVTVKYVNPPREGKTNGSLRLADGSWLSCPPNLLPLFEGTENTTVDIATRQFKGSSGDMVTMVDSGPGGMRAPAPPRQQATPPKPQGGPVGVPQQGGLQPDRRLAALEDFFKMYVTGSVGRHLGSGKAASEHDVVATEAVRVFEHVVGPAFLRLSDLLNSPKRPGIPKVIQPSVETWTNNTRTTPNSEPGDPGPVDLQ